MSFLLPTCGKPLDLSLLLPVMWPHPQPVQHNVRRFLKGGGAGVLRQPSRCMGRSRMRPRQREELWGAMKAAWSRLRPTQKPQPGTS